MSLYILHYTAVDEEGRLSIVCQEPFQTMESARDQQNTHMEAFRRKYTCNSDVLIEEKCGTFHRMAYEKLLIEQQSLIKGIATATASKRYVKSQADQKSHSHGLIEQLFLCKTKDVS